MHRRTGAVKDLCLGLIVLMSAISAIAATSAHAEAIGFVDRAFVVEGQQLRDASPWMEVAHIERALGREAIPPQGRSSLEPGDRLVVDKPGFIVFVHRFADNVLVPVRQGAPWEAKAQALHGLVGAALTWIEAQMSGADQHRITSSGLATLSTRSVPTQTCYNNYASDRPNEFAMPIFSAPQSVIVTGHRTLLVPWIGGAAPFDIRLTDAAGHLVAEQPRFSGGCVAQLKMPELPAGRYRITVLDVNGAQMEESNLFAGQALPNMPETLKAVSLPELDRQLYYASWLSLTEDGRWAFEAVQRVAAMDCREMAVREWLGRWGEFPSCAR